MPIVSKILDLFRDYSPERESKKRLSQARLTLVEAECNLEFYTASVSMLKERIKRLEGEIAPEADTRPARTSIQAPHPGPERAKVGGWTMPDAKLRDRHANA
jgi:hypothetical protein